MPARKPFLIGLCSVSLSILGPAGSAQTGLQFDASVPVEDGSLNLDLAWAGGMNAPQIGELDLDLDGLRDLVVFDRIGDRVMTLLNTGGTGTNRYRLPGPTTTSGPSGRCTIGPCSGIMTAMAR